MHLEKEPMPRNLKEKEVNAGSDLWIARAAKIYFVAAVLLRAPSAFRTERRDDGLAALQPVIAFCRRALARTSLLARCRKENDSRQFGTHLQDCLRCLNSVHSRMITS